jgi:hypothetical protein
MFDLEQPEVRAKVTAVEQLGKLADEAGLVWTAVAKSQAC